MGYTAKAIANFFLDIAKKEKTHITPLKIQKLVYISHGWYLALTNGQPLIDDEYVEAWQYGPVFPSLYHEFKHYGRATIANHATDITFAGDDFEISTPRIKENDVDTQDLLNKIWEVYGNFTGLQLSNITHATDTPWESTQREHKGMRNVHIPNGLINEYYQSLMERNNGK